MKRFQSLPLETDAPFAFTLEPGDLTLKQLQSARLNEADIPDVISPQLAYSREHVNRLAYSREHVNRLYLQEPDDYTVMFQNRDGSKTVYYFSVPVKSGGRDLSSSEFAVLSRETNTPAFRISDNRLAFVRTNERLRRLDGKCTDKKVYYYNLGYADIQSFDTQLTGPGTDITEDVRAMTEMPLNTEREYDLSGISRSGSGSGTGGTGIGPGSSGNLCFSYAASELAGIVRLKNYDTGTYLKNTNGTLSMGTAGGTMNPAVRWSLNYQGSSSYRIRAFYYNQTTQGYLTYNNSLYLQDYSSGYSVWRFDYVSVSGNDYYYIRPYVSSSTALNSSLTCASPAGDSYYWEVNDRRDIITSITAPSKAIVGPDEPLNNLLTISPSNAMSYIVWMNESGTPVGMNGDGEFALSTPGYYELYYWDYYSNTGNDPEEFQPVLVIIPATGQEEFSGKYVNISYSSATRKNIAVSSAGSLSVQNPNGQDIYQTLKLTAVDAAHMEYTISFYVPEIISNAYTGHLKEVCLNYSDNSLSMAEPTQQNLSTRTWYVLKAGTVYYIIHKSTMKMLRIYGNTLTVTHEWGSNYKWDLFYSGEYKIQNRYTQTYITSDGAYDKSGCSFILFENCDSTTTNLQYYEGQIMRLVYNYSEQAYMFYPICSRNGYGYSMGCTALSSSGQVKQLDPSTCSYVYFTILQNDNGYVTINPKGASNVALCVSNGMVVLGNNSSAQDREWTIQLTSKTERHLKEEIYYRSQNIGLPLDPDDTGGLLHVTSDYGHRKMNDGTINHHYGLDLQSIYGTQGINIISPVSGTITKKDSRFVSGYYVVIRADDIVSYADNGEFAQPLYFYFCHLVGGNNVYYDNNHDGLSYAEGFDPLFVNNLYVGLEVATGDDIAKTGGSGNMNNSYVVHCHMSVIKSTGDFTSNYQYNIDPLMFYGPDMFY